MRLSELQLTERATSVLFHYTSTNAALKILTSGNFELASTTGNKSEEQYAPKGRPFFLSLTRTPQGDYHRYVGTGAVLFKMDGDWFNSRYVVKPIDYWERAWLHSDGTRSREAEDRVFSAEPTIPISSITEVHVLLKEQDEFRSPRTRMLMFVAKKQGLPVFLYTDEQAWRLLDRRRAKTVKDAADVLRGAQVPSGPSRRPTDYVKPWIELITKDDQAHLSDRAQRLLKTMRYYGRPDEDQNMSVDLSNARKPDAGDRASAVWLIKYMQSNGFKSTLELKNSIEDKWNKIIDGQQQKTATNEAFDQPYPMTWEHGDNSHDALAKLSNGTNLSIMFSKDYGDYGNEEWTVEFWRNNSQDVTGEGDQQRVFATVLSAIQQFINTEHPARIRFSANKDVEPGKKSQTRSNLYNKLVQRYASSWGYSVDIDDFADTTVYNLDTLNEDITLVQEEPIKLSGTNPAVKEFIAGVYERFPQTWQSNHVMPLGGEGDDQQFAMFELVPSLSKRGAVEVKWIQAYPLGQGVGGRAMKILQDMAREAGVGLTLYPWDKGVVSQSKLMKFYKKQGFQPASKGAKNMQWDPAVNELKIDNKNGKGAVPYNQDIDYFGLRVAMRPSVFLKLALPLPDDADYEHLKQHIAQGGAVGAPFLDIKIPPEWDDGDFSKPAKVAGHEGRHRMKAALALEGDEPVETHIFPKGGYRARDLTPDFVKHLNQSLETQAGGRVLSGPLFTVNVNENFHDGRHPEDKGDSKRLGVPTKASVSTLRQVAKQGGRKGQLAHWMANMKAGRAKHNK